MNAPGMIALHRGARPWGDHEEDLAVGAAFNLPGVSDLPAEVIEQRLAEVVELFNAEGDSAERVRLFGEIHQLRRVWRGGAS